MSAWWYMPSLLWRALHGVEAGGVFPDVCTSECSDEVWGLCIGIALLLCGRCGQFGFTAPPPVLIKHDACDPLLAFRSVGSASTSPGSLQQRFNAARARVLEGMGSSGSTSPMWPHGSGTTADGDHGHGDST